MIIADLKSAELSLCPYVSLYSEYDGIGKEQIKTVTELAYAEVISYNKKNLEKELRNESRQHNKLQSKIKRKEEEF